MNKSEFVAATAEKTDLPKATVTKVIDAIFGTDGGVIADTLQSGDKVVLTGFGSFESREIAAREGRNPQTGKKIPIAAQNRPTFKAGKLLKEALN